MKNIVSCQNTEITKGSLMGWRYTISFLSFIIILASCGTTKKTSKEDDAPVVPVKRAISPPLPGAKKTFTKPLIIDRDEFVTFAETLLGTPYRYGSAVPVNGLDCSGFVTCVFGHFKVKCPRTTIAFTNEGEEIDQKDARPGDIILFTGSDNSSGIVGHMGIVTVAGTGSKLQFIHSASGKNIGVINSNLSGYYKVHFVKFIRILE